MTRLEDRQTLIGQIAEARGNGARQAPACALAGIDPRTIQRWRKNDGLTRGDRRPDAIRPAPSHALTEEERARIVEVANEPRFAEVPPAASNPNSPSANGIKGALLLNTGHPSEGRDAVLATLRLSPRDPRDAHLRMHIAVSYYFEHNYARSVEAAQHAIALLAAVRIRT